MPAEFVAAAGARRELRRAALDCLASAEPAAKCAAAEALWAAARNGLLALEPAVRLEVPALPGRPPRPRLVAARALAQRGLGSAAGRAAFVHAIAHIEFNAINLACDAVVRYPDMPEPFYLDWIAVAADEARHFALLAQRLADWGHAYGDFDAHNGLWEMAERTAGDCLARMALVPRVLEARGLDVTPAMIDKLEHLGDSSTADILRLILREEVGHVAVGSRWFDWCCERAGVEPLATFEQLLRAHAAGAVRPPFNRAARLAAGFVDADLRMLERVAAHAGD